MSGVNWDLARRVANRVARVRTIDDISDLPVGVPVADVARAISAYTGIETPTNLPARETLSRSDLIAADLNRSRLIQAALESPEDSQSRWCELDPVASKLDSCSRDCRSVKLGIQVGRDATSTMGEYFRAPEPVTLTPRLLLIAPNLARNANSLGINLEDLVSSVTIHELTHVLQLTGVPWLYDYLEDLENRFRQLQDQPRASEDELQALGERVMSLQAVMEGHAEHVTDVVAAEMLSLPSVREATMPSWLRRAKLARNIQRRVPGLRRLEVEVHHSPYKAAFDFCYVAAKAGVLNNLWRAPEALPSYNEIDHPQQWLSRIQQ